MKLSREQLNEAYREESSRSQQRAASCLSPDSLACLATGDMSTRERERAVDHLLVCADCADELRAAREMAHWAKETAAAARPEPRQRTTGTPAVLGSIAAFIARPLFLQAAAAILLVVASGLLIDLLLVRSEARRSVARLEDSMHRDAQGYESQIAELRRKLPGEAPEGDRSQPYVNVPIVDLDPRDFVRGEAAPKKLDLTPSATLVTFILNVEEAPTGSELTIEISDGNGGTLWQGRGLKPSPEQTFTITVPTRLLPAGLCRFKLFSTSGERRRLVQEYALQVVYRS